MSAEGLITVEEAQARLLALISPLPAETVGLAQAAGRYLAKPVFAKRDQPPFDASAMDGYAVQGRPQLAMRYRVVGEAGAGHAYPHAIAAGKALRIFTGAPLPEGADHVVIQENVRRSGDHITIEDLDTKTNIRPKGQDFKIGDHLAPRRLGAADLALLAAMNIAQLPVTRRPRLAIISTGDELVAPGEEARPDQITASNGFALKALAENLGAEVSLLPIARDQEPALRAVLGLARGADVIVTIGGASVGDHDIVGRVLAGMGMDLAFWKVALRPGKPLMAGRLEGSIVLGLPGNPVSTLVCAHLFLLPLLRALQGDARPAPRLFQGVLGEDLPANGPRAHYMRARLGETGQEVFPFARQDSALLRELAEANALLLRPPHDGARLRGEACLYLPL